MTVTVHDETDGAYWDRATRPHRRGTRTSWRDHCDALHRRLIDRSFDDARVQRVLKTDLFDEATHVGLVPAMAVRAEQVHGLDIAAEVARGAVERHPLLHPALADVRSLPYTDEVFEQVVSNSTLDHFPSRTDIARALDELHRVTAAEGTLVITMDNLANPIVRLRSILPQRLLQTLRVVPYLVGITVTEEGLVDELERAGFVVRSTGTIMHIPRAPAMIACHLVDALERPRLRRALLRLLLVAELLERLPTHRRTGYYVTAAATRPPVVRRSRP